MLPFVFQLLKLLFFGWIRVELSLILFLKKCLFSIHMLIEIFFLLALLNILPFIIFLSIFIIAKVDILQHLFATFVILKLMIIELFLKPQSLPFFLNILNIFDFFILLQIIFIMIITIIEFYFSLIHFLIS